MKRWDIFTQIWGMIACYNFQDAQANRARVWQPFRGGYTAICFRSTKHLPQDMP